MKPVTAGIACQQLHDASVTPGLVRLWAARGWLKPVGKVRLGGRGRPANVYDMADVWRAYNRWKES